ncbi:MAG: signal peptide peptidase SppA [Chloroflexi bacterium]|nr:signal peptide peptidase SppA [Chloroflexota bacterium]
MPAALKRLNPLRVFRVLRVIPRAALAVRNRLRRRAKNLDYILLTLPASLPALPERRGWLLQRVRGAAPLSLWELDRRFRRIAADPRPQGVILKINGLALSLADLQTLRASILRLRAGGKRVICFAQYYDLAQYYVASAADEILLQPGGELMTIGLRQEAIFLKDALGLVGVQFDVVAITPYKGAYDQFSRDTISPEGREQLEWLLDSRYGMIVRDIAEGRHGSADDVRALIDSSPHIAEDALASGYVDAVINEEGFAAHLKTKHLLLWKDADKKLLLRSKASGEKHITLLKISGLMMPGESMQPPIDLPIPFIGGERAGDVTVVRQVRSVMRDKQSAAVVLFIDSGGGAVVAAEAMTSALEELAKDRPLVVFMNGVAASGGYYVATPARWIVAQPGTITGSIGVITAKAVAGGLREKFHVNTLEFLRGANADIFSDAAPFSEPQRAQMRRTVEATYQQFIERVARSRKLSVEAVDQVGGGRVWTGTQALDHHLVDQLGDLHAAIAKARELAHLPDAAPVALVSAKTKPLVPQVASDPAAALNYVLDHTRELASGRAQVITPIQWR